MKRTLVIVITVLIVLFLTGNIVGAVLMCRSRIISDQPNQTFIYFKDGSEVLLILQDNEEVRLQFRRDSVEIIQSYKHSDAEVVFQIVQFVRFYALGKGYDVKREVTEMCGEIRLHNIAYDLGYKREQTGDCNLDYIADRRWYVNAASKVIGWVGI